MLGPVGKLAAKLLSIAGYQVRRRTRFEEGLTGSLWKDWFSAEPKLLGAVYASNRVTLGQVENWAEATSISNSLWRYGIPELLFPDALPPGVTRLNEIEKEITYSDLLAFLGHQVGKLSYLEIGVSLGKNLLQIASQFPDAEIAGLEIEDLNPVLAGYFERVETVWQSGRDRTVEGVDGPITFRTTEYRLHRATGRPVTYIRGDQYDPETWARLDGRKFNLVFSDGAHRPAALRAEFDHIHAGDLLDTSERFAVVWDDLNTVEMQGAFDAVARRLPGAWHALYWIDGTFGRNRLNGLAANFRL